LKLTVRGCKGKNVRQTGKRRFKRGTATPKGEEFETNPDKEQAGGIQNTVVVRLNTGHKLKILCT